MITQTENMTLLPINYHNIFEFLNKKFGSCYANEDYYRKIDLWSRLYKGYVKEYHEVVVSNGVSNFTRTMSTLNMASQVASDWLRCIVADKPVIEIEGRTKNTSRFVQGAKGNGGVLNSNNFYRQFTNCIEKAFALGTSALVLGVEKTVNELEGYKIDLNSYFANAIIPIRYTNGIITEAAFLSEFYKEGKKHYNLSCHVKDETNKYVIYNFESDSGLKFESYLTGNQEPYITGSEKPFFFIFSPIMSNNIDYNSPLGVSVYANAVDIVLNCDTLYDGFKMDIVTAQRIILMHKSLLGRDSNGNTIAPQDAKKYYMSFTGDEKIISDNGMPQLIADFTPKLNSPELVEAIQQNLNLLSMRCGLGNQYYHFDKVSGVTATEVLSSNMDLIRSVKINLENVTDILAAMIKQIIWIGKNILGYKDLLEDAKVNITIPDGVIVDDNAQKEQDRAEVAAGLMSKAEYRSKWYGETLEDAQKKIDEIQGKTSDGVEDSISNTDNKVLPDSKSES